MILGPVDRLEFPSRTNYRACQLCCFQQYFNSFSNAERRILAQGYGASLGERVLEMPKAPKVSRPHESRSAQGLVCPLRTRIQGYPHDSAVGAPQHMSEGQHRWKRRLSLFLLTRSRPSILPISDTNALASQISQTCKRSTICRIWITAIYLDGISQADYYMLLCRNLQAPQEQAFLGYEQNTSLAEDYRLQRG